MLDQFVSSFFFVVACNCRQNRPNYCRIRAHDRVEQVDLPRPPWTQDNCLSRRFSLILSQRDVVESNAVASIREVELGRLPKPRHVLVQQNFGLDLHPSRRRHFPGQRAIVKKRHPLNRLAVRLHQNLQGRLQCLVLVRQVHRLHRVRKPHYSSSKSRRASPMKSRLRHSLCVRNQGLHLGTKIRSLFLRLGLHEGLLWGLQ